MTRHGVLLEQVLPPHASSAANARAMVREALETAAAEEWAESAQLAVSEVVTNSLVHAGTPVQLNVRVDDTGLRVEVGDGSPHLPVRRDYSLASGTGRGLHLVTGLVDDWGCFAHDDGKVVWFEMRPTTEPTGSEPRDEVVRQARRGADDTVRIELRQVPLLMHLAWQEHASALLREFLLVTLDQDEVASFERHAQASDAMNLLYEQVPAPALGEDAGAIMTMATEPGVTAPRLVLSVPQSSVPSFDTLDAMLDEAAELAASGGLLVPTTQPEVSHMRRWLCAQVRGQSTAAAEPEPWSLPDSEDPRAAAAIPASDLDQFSSSERSLLVTDEGSVIVAVSPSAAALLGYPNAEALVGQPITRIVPPRYHQAHIAGTTLHMVNGRRPLLGVRVRVPVVTADSSEVVTELIVEPRPLQDGHRMFVAEFFDD